MTTGTGRKRKCEIKQYTAKEIIEYLQRRAKLLRRTPTVRDINLNKDGPSKSVIVKIFGSYEKALDQAGLPPLRRPWREWEDDELIGLLIEWYAAHPGGEVTNAMLRMNPELPGTEVIKKRFGGVGKWHEAAGIEYSEPVSCWRKEA